MKNLEELSLLGIDFLFLLEYLYSRVWSCVSTIVPVFVK